MYTSPVGLLIKINKLFYKLSFNIDNITSKKSKIRKMQGQKVGLDLFNNVLNTI